AEGVTTGEEHQPAIDGETASRTNRTAPAEVVSVDRGDGKGAGSDTRGIVALDAGPEQIALDTDHVNAALPVVAKFAAGHAAGGRVIGREIGIAGITQCVVDVVVAVAASAEHAEVDAGPIIDWRGDCRSLRI